jgi:hypothetical protein
VTRYLLTSIARGETALGTWGLTFEMRGGARLAGDVLSIKGLGHAFKRGHRINLY